MSECVRAEVKAVEGLHVPEQLRALLDNAFAQPLQLQPQHRGQGRGRHSKVGIVSDICTLSTSLVLPVLLLSTIPLIVIMLVTGTMPPVHPLCAIGSVSPGLFSTPFFLPRLTFSAFLSTVLLALALTQALLSRLPAPPAPPAPAPTSMSAPFPACVRVYRGAEQRGEGDERGEGGQLLQDTQGSPTDHFLCQEVLLEAVEP